MGSDPFRCLKKCCCFFNKNCGLINHNMGNSYDFIATFCDVLSCLTLESRVHRRQQTPFRAFQWESIQLVLECKRSLEAVNACTRAVGSHCGRLQRCFAHTTVALYPPRPAEARGSLLRAERTGLAYFIA